MKTILCRLLIAVSLIAVNPLSAGLWSGAGGDPNGWKYVPWLGWFYSSSEDEGWMYQQYIGWMYAAGTTQANVALYMGSAGINGEGGADDWFLTGSGLFPGCYSHTLQRWYIYDTESIESYPFRWWDDNSELYVPLERIGFEIQTMQPLPSGVSVEKIIVFMRHGERYPDDNLPGGRTDLPTSGSLTAVGQQEARFLGTLFRNRLVTQTSLLPATYNSSTVDSLIFPIADENAGGSPNRCRQTAGLFLNGVYSELNLTAVTLNSSFFAEPPSEYGDQANAVHDFIQTGDSNGNDFSSIQDLRDDYAALATAFTTQPGSANSYASTWAANSGYDFTGTYSNSPDPGSGNLYDLAFILQYIWLYPSNDYPSGFTQADVDLTYGFFNRSNTFLFNAEEYSRSAAVVKTMGFGDFLQGFEPNSLTPTDANFLLIGGHDGDLWPLAGVFDALTPAPAVADATTFSSSQNPYFTTFLEITLYQLQGVSGVTDGEYAGVSYNGNVLDLSSIGGVGPGNQYVAISTFLDYLNYSID